jgi:EAL domain-containing protein (putative c-di-GMP-specific phosphodiesterase class I)
MGMDAQRTSEVPSATVADDEIRPIIAAADAATMASRDADAVARSAADMAAAAQVAETAAQAVASTAKSAIAITVAAAASAAAEIAAQAAIRVQDDATTRAMTVSASAVTALETIAADLPDDMDPGKARRVAASIAATVAADVIARVKLADDAAERVAQAVALAAEAAALAALSAAVTVDLAAGSAEDAAQLLAGSIGRTEAAAGVAAESSFRVAELAQRRVALLRQAPLLIELRHAVERAELRLHYQPLYSMDTGAVVAVEALLRWQHPSRGLLPPSEFLDLAEGPHLVMPIGDWVIETAVAQAARWQHAFGDRAPTMWVNISCDQLGRRRLVEVVERLLTQAGLAGGTLGLEVTERQLARRIDDVTTDLTALHALDVGLAVDDFGTGYASFDYLRRFTFDEIKIDQSFVSGVQDRTNMAVTSSIVALGRSLGLTVVAEGVETQAQYDRLKELGCTLSQGYLLHRPAPADTISDLLQSQAGDPRTPARSAS